MPRGVHQQFAAHGSHLERYASRFAACEINSSFHRAHSRDTYVRWADSVPQGFRFSVKAPRTMTHERRLLGCEVLIGEFLAQAQGLGAKLGCLLVQLPPSLSFDRGTVATFLEALRSRWAGATAVEPRHATWFDPEVDACLAGFRVARVLADPVLHAPGAQPGGWQALTYLRLHGSPRMYYSAYAPDLICAVGKRIAMAVQGGSTVWCVFDNTASGAAADNGLALQRAVFKEQE
ncbi:MAG: DUF72 domain-containing protein [Ramlibacter sp.]